MMAAREEDNFRRSRNIFGERQPSKRYAKYGEREALQCQRLVNHNKSFKTTTVGKEKVVT